VPARTERLYPPRRLLRYIGLAIAAIVYDIVVFFAGGFLLKANVILLMGTWAILPVLVYLPFILVIRALNLRWAERVVGTLFVMVIASGLLVLDTWGVAGSDAAKSILISSFPLLSVLILALIASIPLRWAP